MQIAKQIKKRREKLGMSQTDLARRMDKNPSTISLWESGTHVPSTPQLLPLAKALKCSPGHLLGRKSNGKKTVVSFEQELNLADRFVIYVIYLLFEIAQFVTKFGSEDKIYTHQIEDIQRKLDELIQE